MIANKAATPLGVKAMLDAAVAHLVNNAPAVLDQFNELAAALGNDANFATTVTNMIATKITKEQGDGWYEPLGSVYSWHLVGNTGLHVDDFFNLRDSYGYGEYKVVGPITTWIIRILAGAAEDYISDPSGYVEDLPLWDGKTITVYRPASASIGFYTGEDGNFTVYRRVKDS